MPDDGRAPATAQTASAYVINMHPETSRRQSTTR
jgi:hypothetical protein